MGLLVDFYLGRKPDHAGRRIEQIWAFDRDALEYHHDFIQWLFPIDTPSPVNPEAPVLDTATAAEFRASAELQARLRRSLDLMLDFYGFEIQRIGGSPVIRRGAAFDARATNWLTPGNHNHLRLTRIMRCLVLCGLEADARALLDQLLELARRHPAAITPTTLKYWRSAVPHV